MFIEEDKMNTYFFQIWIFLCVGTGSIWCKVPHYESGRNTLKQVTNGNDHGKEKLLQEQSALHSSLSGHQIKKLETMTIRKNTDHMMNGIAENTENDVGHILSPLSIFSDSYLKSRIISAIEKKINREKRYILVKQKGSLRRNFRHPHSLRKLALLHEDSNSNSESSEISIEHTNTDDIIPNGEKPGQSATLEPIPPQPPITNIIPDLPNLGHDETLPPNRDLIPDVPELDNEDTLPPSRDSITLSSDRTPGMETGGPAVETETGIFIFPPWPGTLPPVNGQKTQPISGVTPKVSGDVGGLGNTQSIQATVLPEVKPTTKLPKATMPVIHRVMPQANTLGKQPHPPHVTIGPVFNFVSNGNGIYAATVGLIALGVVAVVIVVMALVAGRLWVRRRNRSESTASLHNE